MEMEYILLERLVYKMLSEYFYSNATLLTANQQRQSIPSVREIAKDCVCV